MFEDSSAKRKTFLKIACFGDGGSGKTKFLLSFQDAGTVCVVDTERGTDPYRLKYKFKVKYTNRWKQLAEILDWLERNPGIYTTFAIDSLTVFYQDLVNEMVEFVKNRRGHEVLSQSEWSIIKRRWARFLNRLVDLPMHVVLSMRERDEYEETTNAKGEEVRKKTGNHYMDADKQTKYIFDIVLRAFTEENRKEKTSKFFVRVDKTRYDWLPLYSVYDITKKFAFRHLFAKHMKDLSEGDAAAPRLGEREEDLAPKLPPAPAQEPAEKEPEVPEGPPEKSSTSEAVGDLMTTFAAPDPSEPSADGNDVAVLMTRAGKLQWPDGSKFNTKDGKALIKALFKVEHSKDLKKSQVDHLYKLFGEVLANRASLARDEKGIPFVQTSTSTSVQKTAGVA